MTIVGEVMTRNVVTVAPDTCVADALAVASEHDIDYLPVLDGDQLLGLVCAQDLDNERLDADVSGAMHARVVTIPVGSSLAEAVARMDRENVGCLLVTAGGELGGLVTRGDLLRGGLSEETVIDDRRCVACGTWRHVRVRARDGLYLCTDCLDRTDVRGHEDELGVGD